MEKVLCYEWFQLFEMHQSQILHNVYNWRQAPVESASSTVQQFGVRPRLQSGTLHHDDPTDE